MQGQKAPTVCFFNSNKAWGGGEKWHFTTAQTMRDRGLNTYLITNRKSALAQQCSAANLLFFTLSVSNLSFLNPFKLYKVYAIFRSQKTDVVILNLPSDVKLAGIAARLAGVKKIIYRRGMPHPIRNSWLNRFLFRNILTHVIANSEEVSRSLTLNNSAWFPADKIVLLHNGVDLQKPLDLNSKLYLRQGDEIIIGNAGRLTEQKGQIHLIEMAKLLQDKNINFKLLIAGEGELMAELSNRIREYGLQEQVKLLGHITDMAGFLNSLDIFVFPSLFEGSANTLIEVLQHEIPTIAFDISSNPEIIRHNLNGYLAKPFSAEALADYVIKIMHSAEIREKFSRNGKQILEEKFDKQKNADQFQALISQ